jgi:hypothetical protein
MGYTLQELKTIIPIFHYSFLENQKIFSGHSPRPSEGEGQGEGDESLLAYSIPKLSLIAWFT